MNQDHMHPVEKLLFDKTAYGIFSNHFRQGDTTNERFISCSSTLSLIVLRNDVYKSKIIIDSAAATIEFVAIVIKTGTELFLFKVDMANPRAIDMIVEECSKYHDLNGPSGGLSGFDWMPSGTVRP